MCLHEFQSLTECDDRRKRNNDSDPSITTIEAEDVQQAFERLKKRTASAIGTPKVPLLPYYKYLYNSLVMELGAHFQI